MKSTIKHIIGCLATLAMVVAGARGLGFLLRPVEDKNTDEAFTQIDSFYSLPDNSLEVIVYGSSHAYRDVDPMVMYEQYGIGAYVYSWNWQKINTTKLFLQDSLISQSPRVAVIETFFANQTLEDVDMNGEIYYTRFLRDSKYKLQYLKQCFGKNLERWLSYYMPLAAFHENWPHIEKRSFSPVINRHNYQMGLRVSEKITPVTLPDQATITPEPLWEKPLSELDEIVDICRTHDIEVLFVTMPYQAGCPFADAMAAYAGEKGCGYINFFDHIEECGIDPNTDFRDNTHLNSSGAAKIGAYLGKYLAEHYELTDMRLIDDNPWAQTAKKNAIK